ncbi:MAG: 50S ribosomal protein L18e [Candidatus Pacearchaeota archaeon]|nr:50S ribosomal protein L18e [Candidatus Pacearchaeota archaeon]
MKSKTSNKKEYRTSKTRIKARASWKTNPELANIIKYLLKQPRPLWHQVARQLARPRKKTVNVNIEKINRLTEDEEVVVVPGKVLSKGELDHKLTIAAFKFSKAAIEKLKKKADLMSVKELVEKTSAFKGVNIRIIA